MMEDVPNWDSQCTPSENRVLVSASIGGVPHIREDAPILFLSFCRDREARRPKYRKTKRLIHKYKKNDIVKGNDISLL